MTEFKDFLDQIKIRLTNPLIFSFLISWIIIHWQIFVGGFYLTTKDLDELGHANYLDFVKKNIDWYNGFCYPLFSALIYTALSPLLRIGIQLFNTWINKLGNERIRKVAKEGYIQYEMYDKLLEEVKSQRLRFEEFINKNNELNSENDNLVKQLYTTREEKNSLFNQNTILNKKMQEIFDVSVLNGHWLMSIKQKHNLLKEEKIKIENGLISEKQRSGSFVETKTINQFYVNDRNELNFIIRKTNEFDSNDDLNICTSLRKSGGNSYVGEMDREFEVEFKKILETE